MSIEPDASISVALFALTTPTLDHQISALDDSEDDFEGALQAATATEADLKPEPQDAVLDEDAEEVHLTALLAML
ncbi:MAG: hypothetical protein AAFV53_15780 [Myxococcota bacterium]